MATITPATALPLWFAVLAISIACDVGATAYLKLATDRLQGFGYFWAAVLGVATFAPSIMTFGYAMKIGPSYIGTVGIWAVGVYAANAVVGVIAFGDPFPGAPSSALPPPAPPSCS
jgi:multidrug transporter EmrE-like cation transporter